MHSIWNPWHGCLRCSEGCLNCYMYYLDRMRDQDGARIYRTSGARYPLSKDKAGRYKIRSGEMISVCMTSDFFLEEADPLAAGSLGYYASAERCDFLPCWTKRPQRVSQCLPEDWGTGWDNIFFNVTCENIRNARMNGSRCSWSFPFRHKGLNCAPLLGPIRIGPYLDSEQIEQVACGGENYGGTRCCDFAWVQALREECASRDITFCFLETGTVFIKDGREVYDPGQTGTDPTGVTVRHELPGQKNGF